MIYKSATHCLWLQYNEEKRKSGAREAHLQLCFLLFCCFFSLLFFAKWSKIGTFSSLAWQVEYSTELKPVKAQEKAVQQGFLQWWNKWLLLAVAHTDHLSLRQYSEMNLYIYLFGYFFTGRPRPPLLIKADKNSSSKRAVFLTTGPFSAKRTILFCRVIVLQYLNGHAWLSIKLTCVFTFKSLIIYSIFIQYTVIVPCNGNPNKNLLLIFFLNI